MSKLLGLCLGLLVVTFACTAQKVTIENVNSHFAKEKRQIWRAFCRNDRTPCWTAIREKCGDHYETLNEGMEQDGLSYPPQRNWVITVACEDGARK